MSPGVLIGRGNMQPLVERSWILTSIQRKVYDDSPLRIVNLHGMYGLGKTSLLQQLFDYYKRDCVVISLNFDSVARSHSPYTCSWHEVLGL
jgi:alpha-D-ribose 1-methylphosphonate 5-triphosphate synthase subunit PhnL